MKFSKTDQQYLRIIDANINRAKEGLRVVEEVVRFILNDANLTRQLKKIRQSLSKMPADLQDVSAMLAARSVSGDVGANAPLQKRSDLMNIVRANLGRVEEALRVLEEFSSDGMGFQRQRYQVYSIEKGIVEKIKNLKI
ncbi:MAG: hypothetical protein WC838_06855 [Candidatus Margulisiibacteriota bacterium]|jgi:thiamine-phosphate pyrophosphorylase